MDYVSFNSIKVQVGLFLRKVTFLQICIYYFLNDFKNFYRLIKLILSIFGITLVTGLN